MQFTFVASILVNASGYEWFDSGDFSIGGFGEREPSKRASAQRRLGPVIADDGEPRQRIYDPFKTNSAMFLVLAETEITEAAILVFANRHGPLWDNRHMPVDPSFLDWQDAIIGLNDAVAIWRAIEHKDSQALGQYIEWRRGKLIFKSQLAEPFERDGTETSSLERQHAADLKAYTRGDLVGPATALLDFAIAKGSFTTFSPRRRAGKLSLEMDAGNLLSAAWVQFAIAVAGSKQFGHCEHCGKPFEQDSARIDKAYCSSNCRVKAHLRRKKKAIQLRGEGKGLREISRITGADVSTIRKWINQKGE